MSEFVICLDNQSNPASLILGKVYRTLPDAEAAAHNMLRIIDEGTSEPDGYLYPVAVFCADRAARSGKAGAHSHRGLSPSAPFA
jgi:hypothetical protein